MVDVSLPLNIKDFEKAIRFNVERHDEVVQDKEEGNPLDNYRIESAETFYVPNLPYELLDNGGLVIAPGEDKKISLHQLAIIFSLHNLSCRS